MKKIALIFAGGSGKRMGKEIPKQFLKISKKEIIIRTLEVFEKSNYIDEIYISCIEEIAYRSGFIDKAQLEKLAQKFGKTEYGQYLYKIANNG